MEKELDLSKIDFAYQPIINTQSGKTFAVEALIRNYQEIGFQSINDFFDYLANKEILFDYDIKLRKIAIKKFTLIDVPNLKLFYNIDNRFFTMPNRAFGKTAEILDELDLSSDRLCFELTEHNPFSDENLFQEAIQNYKKDNINIAIDDFGTGVSGLHLLYISDANFVKIDKFFITNIDIDQKKRLFCSSVVEMAHIMGIRVIAEGIERVEEYFTCKDIKVDYLQGYLFCRPTLNVNEVKKSYKNMSFFKKDKRLASNSIDKSFIEKIDAINEDSSLHDLFVYFKEHTKNTFVPIVNREKQILGAIYEVDIKQISYSQYGLSLAKNQSFKAKLKHYLRPVPEIDISWGIDKALEIFNMRNDAKGIFVSKDSKYYGFISLNNLLSLSYKRNLEIAQNQNPLTKLPGNNQIDDFIYNVFNNKYQSQIIYFDFNDFKPFNDTYGFRLGDRAILMFSEILQKNLSRESFIAHIGGDDFFVGFINSTFEYVNEVIAHIQSEFEISVQSLYNEEDIKKGFITAKDRFGVERDFKLLSVSCAIIEICKKSSLENLNSKLGEFKKLSKRVDYPFGVCLDM
ncbi:GGDEF domain-containing protein [Halarcobacter ebronensis]|uniref:GGDEF domain-containing protein n=1 Tax=Halarcobacter ebronensis TaxID=1462615 RepID=A0A4Q1APL9_9BACT|nr:GGDEF domain-containing protein [Halarcobacter ebronensis]RXK08598.1 GGDEF domain-containing protein [Halarcobacter ebronensis]